MWVHTFCAQITAATISAIRLNWFKQFADINLSKSLKISASNKARIFCIFIEYVQIFRGCCFEELWMFWLWVTNFRATPTQFLLQEGRQVWGSSQCDVFSLFSFFERGTSSRARTIPFPCPNSTPLLFVLVGRHGSFFSLLSFVVFDFCSFVPARQKSSCYIHHHHYHLSLAWFLLRTEHYYHHH